MRDALGSLSVVIPAYNAAGIVAETIRECHSWLAQHGLEHEIIIVDDGSTDQTVAVAIGAGVAGAPVQVLRSLENRGKGAAVRRGMLSARMNWALFMDVDHSTRIENVAQLAEVADRADVIIASRRLGGAEIVTSQPLARRFLGNLFPFLTRAAALPNVSDTQCGFKAFRGRVVKPIFDGAMVDRFAFDVEIILRGQRLGARLVEIPVRWDNPTGSTVRWRRDGPRMLVDLARTTWRHRAGGAEARRLAAWHAAQPPEILAEPKPLAPSRPRLAP